MISTIAYIQLTDDVVTQIDKADEELCRGFDWRLLANGYAMTQRSRMYLYLHRLILGAGKDDVVDHVNGDKLDNRRANLRFATKSQNSANRDGDRRRAGTYSQYKGVSYDKRRSTWFAYIHFQGKTRSLGRHASEHEAARQYNKAALETWGEFARLNIITEPEGVIVPASDAQ